MPTLAALFVTIGRDARDAARLIHPGAAAFSGSSTIAKRGRERDVGERRADEQRSRPRPPPAPAVADHVDDGLAVEHERGEREAAQRVDRQRVTKMRDRDHGDAEATRNERIMNVSATHRRRIA